MSTHTSRWHSHLMLLILTLFYIETFVGRQIMAVMIEPIKTEFQVTDAQMGLLTGFAFALVFAIVGLFAGRLADRADRTVILTCSALLWFAITALTGFAISFVMLIVLRMLIAVAEAPITSSSLSLLADAYPVQQRSFAISCFTSGTTISAIIAMTVGAYWVEQYGWRDTFLIISAPAAILAIMFALWVKDPRQNMVPTQQMTQVTPNTNLKPAIHQLLKIKSYRYLILASAIATMGANAFGMWNTTFLVRTYDISLTHAGILAGIFGGGAAAIGILLSGYLSDRIGRVKGILWLPLVGHGLGWVTMVAYLLWPIDASVTLGSLNIPTAMLFCMLTSFFSVWWFSPSITLLTEIVPNAQRALGLSIQTACITLLGVGLGPIVVGYFSDVYHIALANDSLRYALLTISITTLIAMVILFKLQSLLSNNHAQIPEG